MVAIECKVGTAYQLSSISSFGFSDIKSNGQGYYFREYFTSKKEACSWLEGAANAHAESREELDKMLDDITKGFLTIDAATAYIVEVPEEC